MAARPDAAARGGGGKKKRLRVSRHTAGQVWVCGGWGGVGGGGGGGGWGGGVWIGVSWGFFCVGGCGVGVVLGRGVGGV